MDGAQVRGDKNADAADSKQNEVNSDVIPREKDQVWPLVPGNDHVYYLWKQHVWPWEKMCIALF